MKILVCIAKTPDTTSKITFKDGDTQLNEQGVTWIINPYDEWYSLVRALELKEAGLAEEITLISVGGADSEPILRKALAIGGDNAVRIDVSNVDSMNIALEIANFARGKGYDLIMTGKESIDFNNASVGGMLAEALDYNFVSLVTKLDIDGTSIIVDREIEGGTEKDQVNLPVVISAQKGMAEQRIPNMKGIMAARTKPLEVIPASVPESLTHIVKYETPSPKSGVTLFDPEDMDGLVKALHEKCKVI